MKKLFSITMSVYLFSSIATPVFATTPPPNFRLKTIDNFSSRSAMKEQKLQDRVENLKSRAIREIDRRIASLNKLLDRLNEIKKLSPDQRTSIKTQVESQITSLESLKGKIQQDTDLQTLITDVKSIVTSYRIYLLFIPKTHILAAADRITATADKIGTFSAKLQTRIDEAKSKGNDVSALQALLVDIQAKTADAKVQAQNAVNAVTPLTPEGYPGNKPTLQSARTMLQTGRKDLITAREDIQKILQGLRATKKSTTPSGSVTPATSSSTTH